MTGSLTSMSAPVHSIPLSMWHPYIIIYIHNLTGIPEAPRIKKRCKVKTLELESGAMIITHSEKLWVRGQDIITEIIQFFMRERERGRDAHTCSKDSILQFCSIRQCMNK